QTIWAQGDTPLVNAPDPGRVIAHVGQDFPLTLLGDTAWKTGMLWYHVQWATPKRSPGGWAAAPSITFTSPGNRPGWASFDVLSPHLAAYLASFGGNVDAVVYDLTHQRYYAYDVNVHFITGSSV